MLGSAGADPSSLHFFGHHSRHRKALGGLRRFKSCSRSLLKQLAVKGHSDVLEGLFVRPLLDTVLFALGSTVVLSQTCGRSVDLGRFVRPSEFCTAGILVRFHVTETGW